MNLTRSRPGNLLEKRCSASDRHPSRFRAFAPALALLIFLSSLPFFQAEAQQVSTYVVQKPWLSSNQAVVNREVRFQLNQAPPGTHVFWYIGLLDEGEVQDRQRMNPDELNPENMKFVEVAKADPQGICVLQISRANPEWADRTGLVRAGTRCNAAK